MVVFVDAGFANGINFKSYGGACYYQGVNLVKFYSRMQKWTATSTAEAEFFEIYRAARNAQYIRGLMKDFGVEFKPIIIFSDSSSALNIIKGVVLSRKSKHLATKIYYVREMIESDVIQLGKVNTKENIADIFTKALSKIRFEELTKTFVCVNTYLGRCVELGDKKYQLQELLNTKLTFSNTAGAVARTRGLSEEDTDLATTRTYLDE